MEDLDIFSSKGTFKRIILPCPTSRKIPEDLCSVDQQFSINSTETGTDYVKEYVEKEEKELLESASYYTNDKNNFEAVSHGTSVPLQDINNEQCMKIYKTYNFAYRPKANLTITCMKDQIVSMIETNSVIIIQGPTGCGKTTQVPQFILDSCYERRVHCNIIVTQPRRIAAMSIAKRVSQERDWPVGTLIGYQVGLINHTSQDTRLTYCTTGVLLHKLINVKNMLEYTHIILDEVHERDQDMDFLLLVVRKLLRTNSRTVKVVLMSATFEVDRFAKYFSSPVRSKLVPAPIIDVAKRNYFNVAIYYLCQMTSLGPLPEVSATEPNVSKRMMDFCISLIIILDEVDMKAEDTSYDPATGLYERHVILVFLPGIHEIEEMHSLLSLPKHEKAKWDVVVLHSSITNEEQQRIFLKPPKGYRRIILSTNIAESSITVPDVKYVIDFCLTKQLVTDPKTNFQCLQLIWASKTNCEQRAGRTGRVMDGRVYRLVPQQFYEEVLLREGAPEMLRAPLENLVLKAKMLDMGEPKAILALSLDPPDLSNLERTILLLKEAGALLNRTDEMQYFDGELTDLGRIMANLPLDIHVTKLIMLGHVFSVLKETIIIAASMAVKDMFCNPFRQKLLAYNVKLTWADDSCSDCIAFMNVYKVWMTEKANRRLNNDKAEKKWALRNFVQIRVLREVKALVTELTNRLDKLGVRESAGVNKVVWKEKEQPFVLKVVIAGAFYPNYFVRRLIGGKVDEHAGVKLLGGLDPTKTVYVQGWPLRQPGLLYARRIQEAFKDCLTSSVENIKVSFDTSTRVYIQFNNNESSGYTSKEMMRKVPMSVYKAIRMRQCNIPIQVPILYEEVALRKAEEMNLVKKPLSICANEVTDNAVCVPGIKPQLPGLKVSRLPLIIRHINDPGHFWAQIKNMETKRSVDFIGKELDARNNSFREFKSMPEIGTLVRAPYQQNNSVIYHRAVVVDYTSESEKLVKLFFVDYGYTTDVRLCDLRQLDNEDVVKIPALALECVLANIRPSVAHDLSEYWSRPAWDVFWALINKPGMLCGEIYSVANSIVALELIHRSEDGEVNINQCLINKGFATRKEEDYFSRCNHDLRTKHSEMSMEQCRHYESLQYEQDCSSTSYPEAPEASECNTVVNLRGPFSPLEIELVHLTTAGRDKKVNMATNSVNSVLLDTDAEDPHQRLLVAGSVSQNVRGSNLSLYNTTLLPNVHGLMALIVLIFTPHMELRRNDYGTRYIGALCGLGFNPASKKSLFPEHDIELRFDVEITLDDLQFINRLRHWMNIGMQINHQSESSDNMEELIICQNRIKDAFLRLMERERRTQNPETIYNFDKWDRYDDSLFLQPSRVSMIANSIYKLHNALELEEANELHELTEHLSNLRMLTTEDPRNPGNTSIQCKLCKIILADIFDLRGHLYSMQHRRNEEQLGFVFK